MQKQFSHVSALTGSQTQASYTANLSLAVVCRTFLTTSTLLMATLAAHQIRVHLQYLGYPIANDSVYADARIWVRT
jgi:23S rRNA-/tRNA-specific pseudouridylate synthase